MAASAPQRGRTEAFRQGLRELGYVKGRTSSSSGDMRRESSIGYPAMPPSWCVSRLISSLRVVRSVTRAAKEATSTIPIVMAMKAIQLETGSSPAWRDLAETSLDCQPFPGARRKTAGASEGDRS